MRKVEELCTPVNTAATAPPASGVPLPVLLETVKVEQVCLPTAVVSVANL